MDATLFTIITFGVWLCSVVACAIIANAKGRSAMGWIVLGLVFGPIAVLILVAAGPLEQRVGAGEAPLAHDARNKASLADELAKLGDLKERGALTDEEFAAAKAKLIA